MGETPKVLEALLFFVQDEVLPARRRRLEEEAKANEERQRLSLAYEFPAWVYAHETTERRRRELVEPVEALLRRGWAELEKGRRPTAGRRRARHHGSLIVSDPDPNRGTGRTGRMLDAVLADAASGEHAGGGIVVFAHTARYAADLRRRFCDLADERRADLDAGGADVNAVRVAGTRVEFRSKGEERRTLEGRRPMVYDDHAVWSNWRSWAR